MPGHLTREQLYELVWSKPRTTLAKEMGVSDVWIGKQCRALNVPAPPPGYWAHLAASGRSKAKYVKPPLTYSLAERIQKDHADALQGLDGFDANDLEQSVPEMPSLAESPDEAVARYTNLARKLPARQQGNSQHQIVQRLLEEDQRRAAERASYSWRQPLYQGADGLYLLRVLDELAWHWSECGFTVSASRGHDVELRASFRGLQCRFEVVAAQNERVRPGRERAAGAASYQFWLNRTRDDFRGRSQEAPALVFGKADKSVVATMTSLMLSRLECGFRNELKRCFEQAAQDRLRAVRAAEEAALRERVRQEAATLALLCKRQRLLLRAVQGVRRSKEIRSLVADLEGLQLAQHSDADLLARWKAWVLAQADQMDLRARSAAQFGEWMGEFGFVGDANP